ncbi:MAG: YkvA family protein [Bacteroidota bacterium]
MKQQMEKYQGEFSDKSLWKKLGTFARALGVKTVYTVLLLYYAYRRKDTPSWAKRIVLGVLGYLLMPFDAIPDLSPFIGLTDDAGVLGFGLVTIAAYINDEVRQKARKTLSKYFKEYREEDIEAVERQL